jgi:hypothetical protein
LFATRPVTPEASNHAQEFAFMSSFHSFAGAALLRPLAATTRLASGALALAILATLGCGSGGGPAADRVPVFPVQGSITLKGQPMPGAVITLHPKSPNEKAPSPRGEINKDGVLKISTYNGGDGAPAGEYTVTVYWNKLIKRGPDLVAGPNVVPPKYSKPTSSDLVVKVAEAGPNTINLKL